MGLFSAAGVKVNNVPDDPFGFGKNYWELIIEEVPEGKASMKDDRLTGNYGSYMQFKLVHERFSRQMGFKQWVQFPTPLAIQEKSGVQFDVVNNVDHATATNDLIDFFKACGFAEEEFDQIDPVRDLKGRGFWAKMAKPKRNDQGYWELRWYLPKSHADIASMEANGGTAMYTPSNSRPAGGGNSQAATESAMAAELAAAKKLKADREAAKLAAAEAAAIEDEA